MPSFDAKTIFKDPFVSYIEVTEVPHPDKVDPFGNKLVGLQKTDGKYASMTPQGDWNPDSDVLGPWEAFSTWGSLYRAYRSDENRTFLFPRNPDKAKG